ncbi:hypothetical protein HYX00_03285 [Candidatus Woesearchaeota archaeon]|nr:hypothetical protein [Candidatus Woesearchaeota archaeon]
MRIDIIRIDPIIQKKIYEKHSILAEEIILILKENEPIFKKAGSNQIMAIGLYNRYITIFFRYNPKIKQATIATAYTSDKKQIKYYKKVRK